MSLFKALAGQLGFIPRLLTGQKPEEAMKGALINSALVMGGGSALAGAGATSAAGVADPISAYLKTGGAEGSILGNSVSGAGGSSGAVGSGTFSGILGNMKQGMDTAMPYLKAGGDAMNIASQMKGLFGQEQMQAPPMMPPQQTRDPIADILRQQAELEAMRRKNRYGAP